MQQVGKDGFSLTTDSGEDMHQVVRVPRVWLAILSPPRKCRGAKSLIVLLGETNDYRFNHRQVEDNRSCNPLGL